MPGMQDAYQVLQIDPSAVPEVIEAAYHALARLHHPDLNDENGAADLMAELNWAYSTLRDPALRAAYDKMRVAIPITPPVGSLSERLEEAAAAIDRQVGTSVLDFGRYAGMTLAQVARVNPEYLEWLKRHSTGMRYRQQIDDLLSAAHRA